MYTLLLTCTSACNSIIKLGTSNIVFCLQTNTMHLEGNYVTNHNLYYTSILSTTVLNSMDWCDIDCYSLCLICHMNIAACTHVHNCQFTQSACDIEKCWRWTHGRYSECVQLYKRSLTLLQSRGGTKVRTFDGLATFEE